MKKLITAFLLLTFFADCFGQEKCASPISEKEYLERVRIDSSYAASIQPCINYYVALRRDILPKYATLKTQILALIDQKDITLLNEVQYYYMQQISGYLYEMQNTNYRMFQNSRPHSEITNLLVFETFKVYPDTYAMLINPTSARRSSAIASHANIRMSTLYDRYDKKLGIYKECIDALYVEMNESLKTNNMRRILQGEKTQSDNKKYQIIDLLLWAIQ